MKTFRILQSLFLFSAFCFSQKKYQAAAIGFYNVENLFDTEESIGYIDGTLSPSDPNYHQSFPLADTLRLDYTTFYRRKTRKNIAGNKILRRLILTDDFTPNGAKGWTTERYQQKLTNLTKVIKDLGRDLTKTAPVIVGLAEVENRQVVQDLVNHPNLKPFGYKVVHFNSLDKRGIDCALIYRSERFVRQEAEPFELEVYNNNGNRDYTRDILYVKGLLDGEEFHFLVNHWPSRRGGSLGSSPKRVKAAERLRAIIREIQKTSPNAKIIAMGDFNDDPTNESIINALQAKNKKKKLKAGDVYNHMAQMHKKGFGTLAYRDGWNLFDQIITTGNIVDRDKKFEQYEVFKVEIFSPNYLISKEGQYKGYPYRTYGGDTYRPGYSDHFPVFTVLLREMK